MAKVNAQKTAKGMIPSTSPAMACPRLVIAAHGYGAENNGEGAEYQIQERNPKKGCSDDAQHHCWLEERKSAEDDRRGLRHWVTSGRLWISPTRRRCS